MLVDFVITLLIFDALFKFVKLVSLKAIIISKHNMGVFFYYADAVLFMFY